MPTLLAPPPVDSDLVMLCEMVDLEEADGVTRYLIDGEIREYPHTSTRHPKHAITLANLTTPLCIWAKGLSIPRPKVAGGDARTRLQKNPNRVVGVDLLVASPDLPVFDNGRLCFFDSPPLLCAEILSPSNFYSDISDKVDWYEEAGIPLVWILDFRRETVTIYRAGKKPRMVNTNERLTGEDVLVGFDVAVAELFA